MHRPQPVNGIPHGRRRRRDARQPLAVTPEERDLPTGPDLDSISVLVHEAIAGKFLPPMIAKLQAAGVEVRGCENTRALVPGIKPAAEADWTEEYLDLILAVRIVKDLDQAIEHIERYVQPADADYEQAMNKLDS